MTSIIRTHVIALTCLLLPLHSVLAEPERLVLGDINLLIYWQGEFEPNEQSQMRVWLTQVMDTMLLLNGTFPRKEIRIELKPLAYEGAVPFARVLRDYPQGILFYVNPQRPLDEFIRDWTAYHEFTHLFIEYPGETDIWFSEGLASYYQNVLQSRAGLLSADEAKIKLRNGFVRGQDDNRQSTLTLQQLSKNMRQHHAYMRVYWSGALYFLEADLALRESPQDAAGINSLDEVLLSYGECCLTTRRRSGLRMAQEFDRIAKRELFVPLYHSYQQSTSVPDYQSLLENPTINAVLNNQQPFSIDFYGLDSNTVLAKRIQ
jgi:hypothetical protein